MTTHWRIWGPYYLLIVVASIGLSVLADWDGRPVGVFGAALGLTIAATYLLGLRHGRIERAEAGQ